VARKWYDSHEEEESSVPSLCTIPNLTVINYVIDEVEMEIERRPTYLCRFSKQSVACIANLGRVGPEEDGRQNRTHSRNVARSIVSVLSASRRAPPSMTSLMNTSPWGEERTDRGGSARSRALIRDKGR